MAITLEKVVPWGRSFDEYRRMFALSDADLEKRILGCADGPASFNAELTAAGGTVVSCDPLYAFTAGEIREQIDQTSPQIIEYTYHNRDEFVWSVEIPDPASLVRHRMNSMGRFLLDYDVGRRAGRYLAAELPGLPFAEATFGIAVCSHLLFLYSEQLSEQFHIDSICRLMRSAEEARIFPLLELGAEPSRHIDSVTAKLRADGFHVTRETVDYEFQRGGNQMMRIRR